MRQWRFWRRPQVVAPRVEQLIQTDPDLDWVKYLDRKFMMVSNAQADMARVFNELNAHVAMAHDGDLAGCDAWCWPRSVRRLLLDLSDRDRFTFLMVLLKDWFWHHETMAAWLTDDTAEPPEAGAGAA